MPVPAPGLPVGPKQRAPLDAGAPQPREQRFNRLRLGLAIDGHGADQAPSSPQHQRCDKGLDEQENRSGDGQPGSDPSCAGQSSSIPTGAIATT